MAHTQVWWWYDANLLYLLASLGLLASLMLNFDATCWAGDKWTGLPVVAQPSLLLLLKGLLLRYIFLYCGGWCYWHLKHFLNFHGFPKLPRFPLRTRAILTVAGDATSKSKGSKIKFVVGASWMISPLFKQSWKNNSTLFRYAEAGSDSVASTLSWIRHPSRSIYFVYRTQMR